MPTLAQIKQMIATGELNEAYREVRRYGEITLDNRWKDETGNFRQMSILFEGEAWTIIMHNGEVVVLFAA